MTPKNCGIAKHQLSQVIYQPLAFQTPQAVRFFRCFAVYFVRHEITSGPARDFKVYSSNSVGTWANNQSTATLPKKRRQASSGYPSSHNPWVFLCGKRLNISKSVSFFLENVRVIFHWTMLMGERVISALCKKIPPKLDIFPFRFLPFSVALPKKRPQNLPTDQPPQTLPVVSTQKKIRRPGRLRRSPETTTVRSGNGASLSQLSPQPRPETKETSPWPIRKGKLELRNSTPPFLGGIFFHSSWGFSFFWGVGRDF